MNPEQPYTEILPAGAGQLAGRGEARLRPNFLNALRGIWLLTWRAQLTWRKLPTAAISLLVLPILVYLTTASLERWSHRTSNREFNPNAEVGNFARRLSRGSNNLTPEQRGSLKQIFEEEFAKMASSVGPSVIQVSPEDQADQLKACNDRILTRAKEILDETQYSRFDSFQKHRLEANIANAKIPRWGRTGPFYHWMIDFYFFVLLPLGCARSCGAIIREELQADTLSFLTTRPITRARLLIVKFLSQTTWLQIIALIETLLLFATGMLRQIPNLAALIPLFLGAQVLAVLAWSALGTLFGLVSKRYMALALLYGMIVEMGIGRIPTNINTLSLMRHLKILLSHNSALQAIYEWPAQGTVMAIVALLFATAIFVCLASLLFTFKEYHHTTEIQK